jgi:PAS domain S-box-containing protein
MESAGQHLDGAETVTRARQSRAGEGPVPPTAWALLGIAVVLLAGNALAESGLLGHGRVAIDFLGDYLYLLLISGAAVATLTRASMLRDWLGWGLIGLGLAAWAVGEFYFQFKVDPSGGPYPSVADGLYLGFYVLTVIGLRNLRAGAKRRVLPWRGLVTALLGLATLWAWIVFDPVLGTVSGTTEAVATTLAYPFLDLLLFCAVLIYLARYGWHASTALVLLLAGIATTGLADSIYSAQVAQAVYPDQTLVDSLWPAAALLIAAAAWGRPPRRGSPAGDEDDSRLQIGLALAAILIALTAVVWDHFHRVEGGVLVLATLTLIASVVQLALLYRESNISRAKALKAERERRDIEALYTASADASLDCIITTDAEGKVVAWNPAATRTFGYTAEDALGRPVAELIVPPALRDEQRRTFELFTEDRAPWLVGRRIEAVAMRSDHTEVPIEIAVTKAQSEPPAYTAFIRDISVRKHQEEAQERLAAMVRSTDDAMYSATLEGVVLAWNPAAERLYGYSAKEAVGTKLVHLLAGPRRDEVDRLMAMVAAGETVSIETTRVRRDGQELDVSIRGFPLRDETGRVVGYSAIVRDITERRRRERDERRNRERQAWRHQIEEALDNDGFDFFKQPVLELATGHVSHHELLIRLRMDGEMVPPARFLPYAESSPLMRRIDRWAVRRGIELATENPVAINLSATSLSDAGLVAAVQSRLEDTGADPRDVLFEITETAAAENLEAAKSLVAALTQLGCGVALDDFGTGYGSFTYLKHMAVTALKIDVDFIRDLADDPADQRVVGSILDVAHNFGLSTVAEGVEDRRTFNLLREIGVEFGQGYLIGRPGPAWTSDGEISPLLSRSAR